MDDIRSGCAIVRVQRWDNSAKQIVPDAAERTLALRWPLTTGAEASGEAVEVLCLGPTEWLILAPSGAADALLSALDNDLARTCFRATDVSSALVRIAVDNANAPLQLSTGSSLDLDLSKFPVGQCARTRLAGMPVVIRRLGAAAFECIIARSLHTYFTAWLTDAAFADVSHLKSADASPHAGIQ